MPQTLANLDRLAPTIRAAVRELGERILAEFGEAVLNWTIFGEAAAGVFDAQRHAVRSALVLAEADLEKLRNLAAQGDRFGKLRLVAPLILTPQFLADSRDTFPLELIEIQSRHITLIGQDAFAELSFADTDVRLQCEREMKTVLIALHQGLLSAQGQAKHLPGVVHHVVERLSRTLRGIVWLKGIRKQQTLVELIAAVEQFVPCRLPGIRQAVQGGASPNWDTYRQLYADVEVLGALINGW